MPALELPKHIFGSLDTDKCDFIGIFGPRPHYVASNLSEHDLVRRIRNPIGTLPLSELAKGRSNVLIVTDDNTRNTPLHRILPHVLAEITSAGISKEQVTVLIGLGTHRPMSKHEIADKVGPEIAYDYNIVNHAWNQPDQLISLGLCDLGFEVVINKLVTSADLVISVGNIAPHATAGFSGGGKTIMPGICGEKTIADTHWMALNYEMKAILGNENNQVRKAITEVCKKIGVNMIIDVIMTGNGTIADLVAGDLETAYQYGIEIARDVYGVRVPKKADIVIAEAYPTDIDLRQAIKAICSAELLCNDNGIIILAAECPEGIAPQFPDFSHYGFRNPETLYQMVESGVFDQKILAYTLVAVGRIISTKARVILVSRNINRFEADQLGFGWAPDLDTALTMAIEIKGSYPATIVLRHAGVALPLLTN